MTIHTYENQLLESWENVYKQGQLTLWIFLSLYEGEKTVSEIAAYIEERTDKNLSADPKSLYRSLRRYYDTDMVEYTLKPSDKGPNSKIYKLSDTGNRLLTTFVKRNIEKLIINNEIKGIIG